MSKVKRVPSLRSIRNRRTLDHVDGPMHHSQSYPDSVGATPAQQLPYPPGAQNTAIADVHVQGSQQGPPPEAAHHPSVNAMATYTAPCRKVKVSDLPKESNIEECVAVSQSEWFVIKGNFLNEVKDQAKKKQVKIEWPKPDLNAIVISGEPGVVDDIKVQVSMLLQKVCKKESRITGVPAAVHVLESMEDKLRLLETDEKVRIKVTLENGDTNELEAAAQVEGELPRQVCAGTSPSGSRVSVYTGDFDQNTPVGVIVNFIMSDPNTQVGCLKHLLKSGGADAMEDFEQKVLQFMELKPGEVFRTRHGQLKCSQLVHCVLPSWQSGTETNANFIFEALYEDVKNIAHSGSILIPPLTSAPLHYPANTFVRLVMDAASNQTSSDLQVSVFVEELHHANEFQGAFQTRNYQIHQKVPLGLPLLAAKKERPAPLAASVKTISSNLGNFITIVNGDLLQQQADVYINSTNTKLNLKHGQVSQLLLKTSGDDLQKECSVHAPLKPGQVAVTGAKNLKCNKIFHIALPKYKTANSESCVQVFRETVRQILRIARSRSVSSIAIPSLGVANLGYPENVSAKILFQEVITFHSQYPSSIQKFIFVIYEKNVFQAFSKEFAQQMSGEATAQPMTRIEVDSGTPEYIEAVKEFEESLRKEGVKYSIEKVEKIENITEYVKHVALKASIRVKNKKDPLVKRLFHGSRKKSLEPIAVQGFNRNFAADANAARFGRGVYFAVESSYSAQDKFAVPDKSGLRYMFVCRVIIGEYTLGNKGMKTAPPLTPGSNAFFDTLVDNVKSPTMFIALTDAQAYPEYLITFKKLK